MPRLLLAQGATESLDVPNLYEAREGESRMRVQKVSKDLVVELHHGGTSQARIAELLGCSRGYVSRVILDAAFEEQPEVIELRQLQAESDLAESERRGVKPACYHCGSKSGLSQDEHDAYECEDAVACDARVDEDRRIRAKNADEYAKRLLERELRQSQPYTEEWPLGPAAPEHEHREPRPTIKEKRCLTCEMDLPMEGDWCSNCRAISGVYFRSRPTPLSVKTCKVCHTILQDGACPRGHSAAASIEGGMA